MSVSITKADFRDFVAKGYVLIDFWAPWCGPCRMLAPIVEQVAKERQGKLRVAKVNVDEQPELAEQFGIVSIPSMVIFKDGKEVARKVGSMPKALISLWIDEAAK